MFNETAYDLAIGAGCSADGARIAAAIAQAESHGDPRAYNPETAARGGTPQGQGSYGLWQIYRKMHPEFAGQNLYDPATNAAAMFSVSGGCQNWTPWSTFNSGAYRSFLQGGAPASGGDSSSAPSGIDPNLYLDDPDAPNSVSGGFLSNVPAWAPIALLAVGAYFLLR